MRSGVTSKLPWQGMPALAHVFLGPKAVVSYQFVCWDDIYGNMSSSAVATEIGHTFEWKRFTQLILSKYQAMKMAQLLLLSNCYCHAH